MTRQSSFCSVVADHVCSDKPVLYGAPVFYCGHAPHISVVSSFPFLMSLALLFHYLLLNMFRMLIHPSSGACDLFVELFNGLYCSGSMCVGVTLWCGWGGVVSVCRLKHQHTWNQNNTTHEISHQISRKLLRMDVLTSETF